MSLEIEKKHERVGIVIPAFNEKNQIRKVVEATQKYVDQIIIVDDGSKIPLESVVMPEKNITVLRHKINLGKGAAMKTGCFAAKKMNLDIVIFMDGDDQHKPEDIPKFIDSFNQDPELDIIFGSRIIGKDMPLIKMLGNKFLSIATSILFGIYISDTQSGFRGFRLAAFKKIFWDSTRYSVETEMVVNTGKKKLKYKEIEIKTIYHDDYKGTTIIDGIRIFFNMLTWRFL